MFQPSGAYRCSNCNLNYPHSGTCQVCSSILAFLSNAIVTEDLDDQIELANTSPAQLIPEEEKVFAWRRDQLLLQAGLPNGYASAFARDREFDLNDTIKLFRDAKAKHGEERGFELALEILL